MANYQNKAYWIKVDPGVNPEFGVNRRLVPATEAREEGQKNKERDLGPSSDFP